MQQRGERANVSHTQLWSPCVKEILSPSTSGDLPPHLSDAYVTDYFGHSNSGYPQEARDQQGPLFPSSAPPITPPLLFFTRSYREWGPLCNLTDRLQKIISETSVINRSINNAVYLLPISGRVGGTRCITRPGFHGVLPEDLSRLRHAILLPAAKMRRLF